MRPLRDALQRLPPWAFVDLRESDDAYRLDLDLAGVDPTDVAVSTRGRRLVVEAHRSPAVPEGFTHRREGRPLTREVTLPLPPDASAVDAESHLERGVLSVTLPKAGPAEREIPVGG